ncbi:Nucleoporin NUP84 like protein [Verticillium longisporum]|uniref:Nuclear pore complex protein n=1 Tax=Verticillium longisporum TaxID=100787 RepID=A0A8I2ZM43_VERLO|nr:Nucleoporin NUP84 like protein [Verticillium longisporum]
MAEDDCLGGPGSNQQKQERVLELVQRFYNHASERLDQLRHRGSGNLTDNEMDVDDAEDETDLAATISQLRKWESELQTWDLLQRLATLRYPQTKSAAATGGLDAEIHSRKDDLWGSFVAQADRTAERKTVLEWLQHTATTGPAIDELIRDLQQNAERGQIIAHGCIHTRTALKLHKDLLGASRPLDPLAANVAQSLMTSDKAPLVSQLDPDAVTRQSRTDEVESAVYGVLAGDIQSVEKVCKSWDDFMFMHYNALLRSQFDSYVLEQCQPEMSANIDQQFAVFDAVQYHGEESTAEKRLIKSLKVHKLTRDEASMPLKVLQAALITRETSQHFLQQGMVLARERGEVDTEPTNTEADTHGFVNGRDYDTLRVAVHVLIILSTLDELEVSTSLSTTFEREPQTRAIQETVISSYVTLLRLAQYEELIPLYCSKLSMPRAYEILSVNLRHLTDRDTRLNQLELVQKAGLDVLRFVRMQPRLILSQLGNVEQEAGNSRREPFRIIEAGPGSLKYGRLIKIDFFGEDPDAISEEEELLIRSLEWLLLVDEAWPDVFFVGVKVYKYFLGTMRLNAARQLANRVTMSQVLQQRISPGGQEEADIAHVPDIDDAFWADQLEAIGDRQTSSRLLATQARIFRDLECLVKALDTMETIASLTELSREDPSAKRDFWNQVGNEVKNAKEYVEPMFKGWLLVDEDDAQCLQAIRDTYLPETILAYISIHEKSGLSWTSAHNNAFMDGRKVTH